MEKFFAALLLEALGSFDYIVSFIAQGILSVVAQVFPAVKQKFNRRASFI